MQESAANELQDAEENDSSQSQSLIQHDLTHLDLPTQVTARSFASDINVDYGSYEGSPTGYVKLYAMHISSICPPVSVVRY